MENWKGKEEMETWNRIEVSVSPRVGTKGNGLEFLKPRSLRAPQCWGWTSEKEPTAMAGVPVVVSELGSNTEAWNHVLGREKLSLSYTHSRKRTEQQRLCLSFPRLSKWLPPAALTQDGKEHKCCAQYRMVGVEPRDNNLITSSICMFILIL